MVTVLVTHVVSEVCVLRRLLPIVCLAPLPGCELLDILSQELEVPITFETPPQIFDLDEAIAAAEAGACATDPSEPCDAVRAICLSDASRDCDPPSLPSEFPGSITVPNLDGTESVVEANELVQKAGVSEAAEFEIAIPVDTATELEKQGVPSVDLAQSVSVEAFAFTWPSNTLTFDLPPLDIYVSREAVALEDLDAKALIRDGRVTFVGRIGVDLDDDGEFDVGQVAGGTDLVPLAFEESGKEEFNGAVLSGRFTLVAAVPEGYEFRLKQKEGTEASPVLLKPSGAGEVGVKASFLFKVRASDILELADKASGGGDKGGDDEDGED